MAYPRCTIEQAFPVDIPILAQIAGESFVTDRHTRLKALSHKSYNHEASMSGALAYWLSNTDKYNVMKAVSDLTGNMVGWACWSSRGMGDRAEEHRENTKIDDQAAQKATADIRTEAGVTESLDQDPISQLEALTDADLRHWMSILMPANTKCMFIVSVAVVPHAQSHGVGSQLVRWGTTRADGEGVFCWVHSSEAGQRMLERQGFVVVGSLTVDLDKYATTKCDEAEDGTWGNYTFRYMKRLPIEQELL